MAPTPEGAQPLLLEKRRLDMYMGPIYRRTMQREFPDFHGFEWDGANRDKNLKHNVTSGECEQVFFNQPVVILDDPKHSMVEDRFAAFGQTDAGRRLLVVYTLRKQRIRVISARDMNRRERTFYESA